MQPANNHPAFTLAAGLAPAQRFTALDDNEQPLPPDATTFAALFDHQTGLTWLARRVAPERVNHKQAVKLASEVRLFGHADWRLPEIEALESIRSLHTYPAIYPEFKGFITPNDHWSSSLVPENEDCARLVYFHYGYSHFRLRNYTAFVLAVRGGAVVGALPGQ